MSNQKRPLAARKVRRLVRDLRKLLDLYGCRECDARLTLDGKTYGSPYIPLDERRIDESFYYSANAESEALT